MPQRVRRRVRHARRDRRRANGPGLPDRRARPGACARAALAASSCTRPASTARRRGPGTPARPRPASLRPRHALRSSTQRRQQPHVAPLPGLGRVDEERPLADVAPAQRERLLRPQPRVGQHRDQRRVPTARSPLRIASTVAGASGRTSRLRRPARPCAPAAPDCARSARTPTPAAGSTRAPSAP